jgi:hypothetical protein
MAKYYVKSNSHVVQSIISTTCSGLHTRQRHAFYVQKETASVEQPTQLSHESGMQRVHVSRSGCFNSHTVLID